MVFRLEAERRKSRVGGTGRKRKEVEERSRSLEIGCLKHIYFQRFTIYLARASVPVDVVCGVMFFWVVCIYVGYIRP